MLLEEVIHDADGKLLTDTLATYKIPDIHSIPGEIQVHFLEDAENPPGIFQSKTVGEPPFLYGIGAYFAVAQAMKAFRPDVKLPFSSPLTPEKILLALYPEGRPV
jgi:xanthine dehydrogenase large subunit